MFIGFFSNKESVLNPRNVWCYTYPLDPIGSQVKNYWHFIKQLLFVWWIYITFIPHVPIIEYTPRQLKRNFNNPSPAGTDFKSFHSVSISSDNIPGKHYLYGLKLRPRQKVKLSLHWMQKYHFLRSNTSSDKRYKIPPLPFMKHNNLPSVVVLLSKLMKHTHPVSW